MRPSWAGAPSSRVRWSGSHPPRTRTTASVPLSKASAASARPRTAREAAYRIHEAYPDCSVFWVPADNPTSFDKAYRDIGQALGIKGLDSDKANLRALVHEAPARSDANPWLWIIDNADDWELLSRRIRDSQRSPSIGTAQYLSRRGTTKWL